MQADQERVIALLKSEIYAKRHLGRQQAYTVLDAKNGLLSEMMTILVDHAVSRTWEIAEQCSAIQLAHWAGLAPRIRAQLATH